MGIWLEMHGVGILIRVADPFLRNNLYRALSTFGFPMGEAVEGGEPERPEDDVEVHVVCGETAPQPEGDFVGRSIEGVDIYSDGDSFSLAANGTVFRVEPGEGTARGTVPPDVTPQIVSGAAQNTILSILLLLRPRGYAPLHAAALARDGRGLLIAAPSGSGKTTLAYTLVKEGWDFLSDDSVLLYQGDTFVDVLALRRLFALKKDSRVHFPELVPHWSEATTSKGKHWVAPDALYPGRSVERSTPELLLFPRLVDGHESEIRPISRVDAIQLLAEQSALSLLNRVWTREHFALLGALVKQAPSFELLAGRDLLEEPERAGRLVDAAAALSL
jgi:hypothetical protein